MFLTFKYLPNVWIAPRVKKVLRFSAVYCVVRKNHNQLGANWFTRQVHAVKTAVREKVSKGSSNYQGWEPSFTNPISASCPIAKNVKKRRCFWLRCVCRYAVSGRMVMSLVVLLLCI